MSPVCVRAEGLAKRFFVLQRRRSALRTLRALLRRERLKRERWVLRDVSFEIRRGEKLALLGVNGSGKTTLLRILCGIYGQTSGRLQMREAPRPLFDCTVGFHRDLPVVDNVFLFGAVHGVERAALEPRIGDILEAAELGELRYAHLKELSTGQLQRLALAVFSHTAADFIVLDEVLANLDHAFRSRIDRFFRFLVLPEKTVIMTSHDAVLLRRYCHTALWLDHGHARMYGPISDVLSAYERSFTAPPAPT